MMKSVKMILFVSFFVIIMSGFSYGQHKISKVELYLFGSMNMFGQSGAESDYMVGENEFPITESHSTKGFGFGVNSSPVGTISVGIEVSYNLSTKATITDPVDNDSAEIDTYKFGLGFLALRIRLMKSKNINAFIQGGGGGYYLMGVEEEATELSTNKGYILELNKAEKNFGFAAYGGAGVELMFSRSVGVILSARYLYLASKDAQNAFVFQVGFRFLL